MALITNGSDINFGSVNNGQNIVATHASVELADGTLTNVVLWSGQLSAQRTLVPTDPIVIPAGDLDFEIPPGALQDAAIVAILTQGIGQYTSEFTVRLGTGPMGTGGTTNEVATATGYSRQTGVTLAVQAS